MGLREKGASTKRRTKPVALFNDVEHIIHFMWCIDTYEWLHPRQMIQMTWYLLVAAYYGLRPGEIIQSSSHREENEGVLYKDTALYLTRHDDRPKYLLKVRLRNRKNQRAIEGLSYVTIFLSIQS